MNYLQQYSLFIFCTFHDTSVICSYYRQIGWLSQHMQSISKLITSDIPHVYSILRRSLGHSSLTSTLQQQYIQIHLHIARWCGPRNKNSWVILCLMPHKQHGVPFLSIIVLSARGIGTLLLIMMEYFEFQVAKI